MTIRLLFYLHMRKRMMEIQDLLHGIGQKINKATSSINTKKVATHWDNYGKTPPKQWLHSLYLRKKVLLQPLKWLDPGIS